MFWEIFAFASRVLSIGPCLFMMSTDDIIAEAPSSLDQWLSTLAQATKVGVIFGGQYQDAQLAEIWILNSLSYVRLNVGLIGATFVLCLFGFPETKWHRLHPDEMRKIETENAAQQKNEKINTTLKEGFEKTEKLTSVDGSNLSHTATAQRDQYLRKGSPSKQQFRLFQTNANPLKSIALDLWIPWKLFAFPIVEFASFVVSWSASCFLTVNLTQSQAFAAPPYEFKPLVIGFFNFAVLVGAIIGFLTAGPLSDWISMQLTRRNNGVREPEMRLPTMIPYFILMLIGNFVTAFGWKEQWSWRVSCC